VLPAANFVNRVAGRGGNALSQLQDVSGLPGRLSGSAYPIAQTFTQ
jgi:hypothetical protein